METVEPTNAAGLKGLVPDSLMGPLPATLAARGKTGRPAGGSNRASRQMTSLAQRFRECGLDWRADFADAIKARQWRRIQLWVKLMPYMLTGGKKAELRAPAGKRRLTKTALAKLKELEERGL